MTSPLPVSSLRGGAATLAAATLLGVGAATALGEEQLEIRASVENPTWATERAVIFGYSGPDGTEDIRGAGEIWVLTDQKTQSCPARATGMPQTTVWDWEADRLDRSWMGGARIGLNRSDKGRMRVCVWTRLHIQDRATGAPVERWQLAQASVILRRVAPTARERRIARPQIRRQMQRYVRAWARYGQRAKIVGPKISRIDPTFAYVAVVAANRRQRVQGGHTIFHLRNGKWRPLESSPAGQVERWCEGDYGPAGRVPWRVVNGFLGKVC